MQDTMISEIKNFREKIFVALKYRADATMELIDSIAGNINAKSITELSLNPAFHRSYNSVSDAIENFHTNDMQQIRQILVTACKPTTQSRPYNLFALDCTSSPRKYAQTLEDKSIVYASSTAPGNKPITIGHQYSALGYLQEKSVEPNSSNWFLPLSIDRVASNTTGTNVGANQLHTLMPLFSKELNVVVVDSAYSTHKFIYSMKSENNVIMIARSRANRIFCHQAPEPLEGVKAARGHHVIKYGKEFKCNDSSTWGIPDETTEELISTKKDKILKVEISCWNDLLIRQKDNISLQDNPFSLVRIRLLDANGNQIFKIMWLMVMGERRKELTLSQIFFNYRQRFDIEHFFRFGKTRLLIDKFQTADVKHEESWWRIVLLAYAQLFVCKELAKNHPRSWEKYLPQMKNDGKLEKSPRQVQHSFVEITKEIGTPASRPKPRGIQLGRIKGTLQPKRAKQSVIFKSQKPQFLEVS